LSACFAAHRGALQAFFYRRVRFREITTPELRTLAISGTFSIDDTESFAAFLRAMEGVRVGVTAMRIRVWKRDIDDSK
jgi:ferric-dicitrate binding protein FerR (iron transport regulator)